MAVFKRYLLLEIHPFFDFRDFSGGRVNINQSDCVSVFRENDVRSSGSLFGRVAEKK